MPKQITELTQSDLMKRWNIDGAKLWLLQSKYGLSEIPLRKKSTDKWYSLRPTLFRLSDVEAFEKEHPELTQTGDKRKLHQYPKHRERCRAVAELRWKQDRTLTIADLVVSDEINGIACEGRIYREETIRDWIKDLCPDRSPGRRKKKK